MSVTDHNQIDLEKKIQIRGKDKQNTSRKAKKDKKNTLEKTKKDKQTPLEKLTNIQNKSSNTRH